MTVLQKVFANLTIKNAKNAKEFATTHTNSTELAITLYLHPFVSFVLSVVGCFLAVMFMSFDAQELFANLAEQEKIKGHHSPEGRAIRVLSRALSGWSAGNLSPGDVAVLCDQAMEDWLKARLRRSPWSAPGLPALVDAAFGAALLTREEAARLHTIHGLRSARKNKISRRNIERALEFCLHLLEKRW
jgi:hypothetical protein